MKATRETRGGFSLVEVMIAMFLVMAGVLVIMMSMVAMSKSNRYSQRMDIASYYARFEMERVRNIPFASVVSETGAYGEFNQHTDYRHELIVTTVGAVKQVVVRVYFEGDRRRVEMVTFVADI